MGFWVSQWLKMVNRVVKRKNCEVLSEVKSVVDRFILKNRKYDIEKPNGERIKKYS